LITNNPVTLHLGNVHYLAKISAGVDDVKGTNVAKTYTIVLDSCEVKTGNYTCSGIHDGFG